MANGTSAAVVKKSTLLLVLAVICLVNAALIFRAGVNTLYFIEDPNQDYVQVTGTVISISENGDKSDDNARVKVPTFSFVYQGKPMEREAPALQWAAENKQSEPYKIGQQTALWIHKYKGDIILPPQATQQSIGISQLVLAGLFLVQAMVFWWLRGYLYQKKCKRLAKYSDGNAADGS